LVLLTGPLVSAGGGSSCASTIPTKSEDGTKDMIKIAKIIINDE
jgi:hypothetical protein